MKYLISLLLVLVPLLAAGAEEPEAPAVDPEELEDFRFRQPEVDDQQEKEAEATVEPLSAGQRFLLKAQRNDIKELIARDLGVMTLRGNESDLSTFQALYDRRILKDNQVSEWQAVGVLLGDILAEEYSGLEWVSYEDELGANKALQWRNTRNFVFPVTAFSKRLQFGERLDVRAVYDKITAEIDSFIEYERSRASAPKS